MWSTFKEGFIRELPFLLMVISHAALLTVAVYLVWRFLEWVEESQGIFGLIVFSVAMLVLGKLNRNRFMEFLGWLDDRFRGRP